MFLDESGVNLSMARRYAWSTRGEPAYGDVPVNRGPNQTLICAVRADGGLIAPMQVAGGTTGEVFAAYGSDENIQTVDAAMEVAAVHEAIVSHVEAL